MIQCTTEIASGSSEAHRPTAGSEFNSCQCYQSKDGADILPGCMPRNIPETAGRSAQSALLTSNPRLPCCYFTAHPQVWATNLRYDHAVVGLCSIRIAKRSLKRSRRKQGDGGGEGSSGRKGGCGFGF